MEKSWLDAIIRVLRENGGEMHYERIADECIRNGYYIPDGNGNSKFTVHPKLRSNPHLFEEGVHKGYYKLVGTSVTTPHPRATGTTVGRATPVVVRPSTAYAPGDSNYKKASKFITSEVPSELEMNLLELIVNFRLPLVKEDVYVCFADILDYLEVEFSDNEEPCSQSVDTGLLQEKLKELKTHIADIERQREGGNVPNFSDIYGPLLNRMGSAAVEVENLLEESTGNNVEVKVKRLGRFIPGDKPKVVIYYKNIEHVCGLYRRRLGCAERWWLMAAVFVHEMFHAWNYSKAKETSLVLAIDEPMVEFETLYFLKELGAFTSTQSPLLHDKVLRVNWYRNIVLDKQQSIGDVAAYGFGYYLFDKLSGVDSIDWIETYSVKSAFIKGRDSRVGKATKALIPVYPFTSEADVMKLFRKIIFDGRVPFLTAGNAVKTGSDVSLRKLVLACIEIIGRKYFEAKELYAFAPIFKLCAAVPGNLEDALKKQLDELVKDGVLEVLSDGYYSMKLAGVEDKPISKVKTPAKSKSGTKAKSIPFAVKFPDDDVEFNEGTAVERFIKSLKHIGLSRVQSLGIMRNGYNLVSDVEHPDNRGKSLQHNEDDKYIITKLGNGDKKGYLYQIANRLGINIKIYDTII